ncbi:unnamed protein product (macronuclear) [Paramecium tetraurelia]|uniref:Protein kinase domain-containing protein n=1 Tax=Paramecium tetraurelia TaxID=5888 RepID=A0C1M3_PARTE|nr:uncharacterized protein GSPATT00034167001 [Paramecium tetraurelia]CAK64690.1 unnamed protein product [Paramecium tetraurelia]|eukprot:XP_001432087.1 hypothetical protein (macronuclear) [Paramecium tetraurelia strain d4-2]
MKNCSQSYIFSTKLSQIIRNGCTVTITVYQDRLSLTGLRKTSKSEKIDKEFDFQTTQYVVHWDYSQDIESFSLCKQNAKKYTFSASNDQLSQLKSILSGSIGFANWESDYKYIKHIRDNSKSQVILGKQENQFQVLKRIDYPVSSDELLALKLLRENPHPNVLGFNSYYIDNMHCYIAMDYLSHGTLLDLQKRYNFKIPMSIIQEVMQQILEGLNHLHQLKIIHRDIKYDNIMIASFNPLQIKIIDLGLSAINNTSNSRAGTVGYMAPEVFSSSRVTEKIDIFSAGAVFHKLLVGRPIYEDYWQNQAADIRISSHIQNKNAQDLLHQMLSLDPKLRYNAQDCIGHPFFTDETDQLSQKAQLFFYLSPKQAKLQVHTPATDFVSNQNVNPFRLN